MTRETLQNIFRNPYSLEVWQKLLINLFGATEIRKTPAEIENDKQDKVNGYLLGELNTSDRYRIGLFAFEVGANTKIEMNRVGLRSLVRSYTKYQYDAAISVYYNDKQWRLSFISDLKGENTAPKRFTYVFGNEVENYRTAAGQLIKLYDTKPTFDSIKDAFSVEKLSKDFFAEYKKQYDKFVGSIGDNKSNRDYVKKMMGRLVFLQFLQKKGWMNGDQNYLQNLYNNSEHKDDFLEKVLEPLFFEVLNTKEENRNPEKIKNLGVKVEIPYLNGGLFERDSNDQRVTVFDASYFANLLEFFSHYNFTIDENDPYDAEVGIDPEMLGHIFENLLEDNKDKGAFYTPKEIVQYMCRQSLIEYLQSKLGKHSELEAFVNRHDVSSKFIIGNASEIERHLDKVKICDPAIGSGAFPMGILNEIFHCKMALDLTLDRAETKKAIIQNSIYGVDIEQGAVDIARLRFWLSLVVDEDIPQPLPNLDYKIMCGNSLLSRHALDTPIKEVFAEYNRGKKKEEQFTLESYKALVSGYTNNSNKEEKAAFRTKIEEIKRAFKTELDKNVIKKRIKLQGEIDNLKADNLFGTATKEELKLAKEKEKKLKIMLDNEANVTNNQLYADAFEWRFELPALLDENGVFEGFDIVIGNPPYVQIAKGLYSEHFFKYSEGKDKGKQNLYKLFVELAYNISNDKGISCLIVQSSLLCDLTSKYTRELILDKTRIIEVIEFPKIAPNREGQVFESALQGTCIYSLSKEYVKNNRFYISVGNDSKSIGQLPFEVIDQDCIKDYYPEDYAIPLLKYGTSNIINKVNAKSVKFKSLFETINQGDVNLTAVKSKITTNTTSVKLLRGRNIARYNINYEVSEYIEDGNDFKQVKNNHTHEYLVCQEVTGTVDKYRLHFAITSTNESFLFGHTANKIRLKEGVDISFILGLLNSKLMDRLFRITSTNNHVGGYEIKQLPIANISEIDQQPFIDRVTQILELKKENPTPEIDQKILNLEAEIDQMVYTLYNLTPDEINLIENR